MSMLSLQMMPTLLGQYRELGFLRRLRTTPASPRQLLTAVLLEMLAVSLVVGLVMLGLPLVVGVGHLPRLAIMALVLVPTAITFLAMGSFVAAVIPSSRVAGGVGAALSAVMWFFAGMWYPRALFPGWLAAIADWVPGGAAATAMTDAAAGTVHWQPFACFAIWAVVSLVGAARFFRWE